MAPREPITCAAGVDSIEIIEREGPVAGAAAIEQRMTHHLKKMAAGTDLIGESRGRGVLRGVELVLHRNSLEPANACADVSVPACQYKGQIVQARGSMNRKNVIRLESRMVSKDAQVEEGMAILKDVLWRVKRAWFAFAFEFRRKPFGLSLTFRSS